MSSNPDNLPPIAVDPSQDDPSIPVLTEQLTLPPLDFDTSLPFGADTRPPVSVGTATGTSAEAAAAALDAAAPEPRPATALRPAAATAAGGGHWARIEIELRSSILRELSERLPQDVEAIVKNRMDAALDELLARLALETRMAIAASLGEIVERAVQAELQRLRSRGR